MHPFFFVPGIVRSSRKRGYHDSSSWICGTCKYSPSTLHQTSTHAMPCPCNCGLQIFVISNWRSCLGACSSQGICDSISGIKDSRRSARELFRSLTFDIHLTKLPICVVQRDITAASASRISKGVLLCVPFPRGSSVWPHFRWSPSSPGGTSLTLGHQL
jgi:hypothetical protein